MKKNKIRKPKKGIGLDKILRIMRLTIFIVLISLVQTLALNTYSQQTKLTLNMSNVSVEEVIDRIENSTEYYFLYNKDIVNVDQLVNIKVTEKVIDEVLNDVFENTNISYLIQERQILLTNNEIEAEESTQQLMSFTGRVTDSSGQPLPGVTVHIKGTTNGTITDINGHYTLSDVSSNAMVVFSFVGMKTVERNIDGKTIINIIMEEEAIGLEEVVAVGYGTKKKATLSGAVASVKSDEILATKNQNVQNMLTGKVAGVRVIQKTSEPGEFSNQFDIRGFGAPLIVIDGVPRGDFQRLDPNEIESISVLKDASAAVYGVRAANGVVLVQTKGGQKGKPKLKYSTYYGFQVPAEVLKPVGAIDRMTLFNEKSMRSVSNPVLTYADEEFEAYKNGDKKSTDWYDAVLSDYAPQQQHNLTLSGGSENTDYFINMGFMEQEGFWKTGDLNYERYNLRSNINAKISDNLKFSLKLNGILDERNKPILNSWEIFAALWRSVPNESIYANNNPIYYAKPTSDIPNVVAATNSDVSGYNKSINKIFQSTAQLAYDIPGIKGLKVDGLFSFDTNVADNSRYTKEYFEYNYDAANDTYSGVGKNSPTSLERYYGTSKTVLYQLSLNYVRTFDEKHNFDLLILSESSHTEIDNIKAFRQFSISLPYLFAGNAENQEGTANASAISEYASNGIVGRFDYNYAGKYIVGFNFRYDGSSRFSEKGQYGFFPSGSLAWRISEESFMKNNYGFIDNLKIRATYGKMGDDGAVDYQFISGYDYPNTSGGKINNFPTGYVFNGAYTNALGFRAAANPNITWYTVKTFDIGLDADFWKGKLGFTFDLYQRDREGLLANRLISLPGTFGSTMPQENLNSDRTKGFDIELRHQNKIGKVSYSIAGNLSFTRTMNRYVERASSGNSYDNWRHNLSERYNDIWFGLGDAGRYTSYEEIANSDIMTGIATLPGDYIYEDWNEDGVIDDGDFHPIATTINPGDPDFQDKRNYPLLNFGLNIAARYNGFDVNLLFQGAGMSYVSYGEAISTPLLWNGNALGFFMDRWHPVDPDMDPYNPGNIWISGKQSYGGTPANPNSTFLIQNGTYLRLKTVEIGYTLPSIITQKIGIEDVRFFMNGYNLLTITGVEGLDPEHPAELYGYMYPLNKTINLGANITF